MVQGTRVAVQVSDVFSGGGYLRYWVYRCRDVPQQATVSGQLGNGSDKQDRFHFGIAWTHLARRAQASHKARHRNPRVSLSATINSHSELPKRRFGLHRWLFEMGPNKKNDIGPVGQSSLSKQIILNNEARAKTSWDSTQEDSFQQLAKDWEITKREKRSKDSKAHQVHLWQGRRVRYAAQRFQELPNRKCEEVASSGVGLMVIICYLFQIRSYAPNAERIRILHLVWTCCAWRLTKPCKFQRRLGLPCHPFLLGLRSKALACLAKRRSSPRYCSSASLKVE